jgi:hypothetical protein
VALRNLFACLVHEAPDCALDLARNLRLLDPASALLLYNGSDDPELLGAVSSWTRLGATLHPRPRPMRWGRLHGFALDCMAFALDELPFDTLTIVDSDQLLARRGYSEALAARLAAAPQAGMLGSVDSGAPYPGNPPAASALAEIRLWRAYLRRFPGGLEQFPRWTMWPGTVFTRAAARDLVDLWRRDERLRLIVGQSRMVTTEEVVLPTLVRLLGYTIARGPSSPAYIRFREPIRLAELRRAAELPNAFWLHPVPRRHDDPLRAALRALHGAYAPV